MVSLKNRQSGFTLVELLIVIVVIGILAALVITTFAGVQQRARNSERQTDINAIASQLEAYYASNGTYPTLANITDPAWRSSNDFRIDPEAFNDPSSGAIGGTLPTATSAHPTAPYGYTVGASSDTYNLTARYEGDVNGDTLYTKQSN